MRKLELFSIASYASINLLKDVAFRIPALLSQFYKYSLSLNFQIEFLAGIRYMNISYHFCSTVALAFLIGQLLGRFMKEFLDHPPRSLPLSLEVHFLSSL